MAQQDARRSDTAAPTNRQFADASAVPNMGGQRFYLETCAKWGILHVCFPES
jgi:hypothetical protein